MINIEITLNKKWYEKIEIKGHAEYALPGQGDIVCSAISTVEQLLENYIIENEINADIKEYDDYLCIDLQNTESHELEFFLNEVFLACDLMFQLIEDNYPKNVNIKYIEL